MFSRRRKILKVLFCFSSAFLTFTTFSSNSVSEESQIIFEDASNIKFAENPKIIGLPSSCKLPDLNPWNDEIMPFVNLDYQLKSIRDSLFIKTSLQHRSISVQLPNYGSGSCSGRCIIRESEFKNFYGPWKRAEEKFDCELVHVKCNFYLFYIFPYRYERVHYQIVPVERMIPLIQEKKYNIFVILIDSTAHSQANRNLPKSLHFMKERLKATTFPYVNKVARNSRPNGFSLLLGKSLEGVRNEAPDLNDAKACDESMDGFHTVLDDMREAGYRTMYSEDWPTYFYTQNGCTGFTRQIMDHTITPLMHEISVQNPKLTMDYQIFDMNRREHPVRTQLLFDYFGDFIESYKDEPKFGWIWSMDMSHDKPSPSIGVDTMLYKLLVKHQKELDNSFVFLMADHGLTYGKVLDTETAKLDVNNPMLTVSLPRELRNSEVRKTLMNNAKKLVTHYDTRATWLDIAKFQNSGKRIESAKMKIPGEKGKSLLRSLEDDRTCQNLPIPAPYCICEVEKEILPLSTEAFLIGSRVILEVNNYLAINEPNVHRCGKWNLAEVISFKGAKPVTKTGTYYITVRASEPYDKAVFSSMVSVNAAGDLTVEAIERRDQYGNRGDCSAYERYCHCI